MEKTDETRDETKKDENKEKDPADRSSYRRRGDRGGSDLLRDSLSAPRPTMTSVKKITDLGQYNVYEMDSETSPVSRRPSALWKAPSRPSAPRSRV